MAVCEADAETGRVVLAYEGPTKFRRAVELNLGSLKMADSRVSRVEFVMGG